MHLLTCMPNVGEQPSFSDLTTTAPLSKIVTHGYLASGRKPPPHIAGMLLCAIISDTLNLMGPTTTQWDKMMVAILAIIAGVRRRRLEPF